MLVGAPQALDQVPPDGEDEKNESSTHGRALSQESKFRSDYSCYFTYAEEVFVRSADTDHIGCETLKQTCTVSENGMTVELKHRIYGNSPLLLIPIEQANIPGSSLTPTCHRDLRLSVILCRLELDTRHTKFLRRGR